MISPAQYTLPVDPQQAQQHTIEPGVRDLDPKNPKLHMIQSRADMDFDTVTKYARMMLDGIIFEPGKAYEDENGNLWGYDGKHRHEACIEATNHAENTSKNTYLLRLDITPGTKEDAEWAALAANQFHGLPRSERDMERIIREAFLSPRKPSEREVARHTGFSRRQVGNVRKKMQNEGLLDENYTPIVKRGNQEFEQDNTQRAEKIQQARQQHVSGTPGQMSQSEQFDIPGTEKYYSPQELVIAIRQYLAGEKQERVNYLQNIIQHTVVGQAYLREIETGLRAERSNAWRRADLYAAAKTLLTELQQHSCVACGFAGSDAQLFPHQGKWFCAKCYHIIQQSQPQQPQQLNTDASVLGNLIFRQIAHLEPDQQQNYLKKIWLTPKDHDRLEILSEMIPGFPPGIIQQWCGKLYKQFTDRKPTHLPDWINRGELYCVNGQIARLITFNANGFDNLVSVLFEGDEPNNGNERRVHWTALQPILSTEIEAAAETDTPETETRRPYPAAIDMNAEEHCDAAGITPTMPAAEEENYISSIELTIAQISNEGLERLRCLIAKELNERAEQAGPGGDKPAFNIDAITCDDLIPGRSALPGEGYAQKEQPPAIKRLCADCEFHRNRNHAKPGKSFGQYYHGKCIREGGLCDRVAALMEIATRNFENCAKCGKALTGPGNFWYDHQHHDQAICDACWKPDNRATGTQKSAQPETVEYRPVSERYQDSLDEILRLKQHEGMSARSITRHLRERGFVNGHGHRWSKAAVDRVIQEARQEGMSI